MSSSAGCLNPLACHVYYARLLFLDGIRRGAAGEQWNELNAILSQLEHAAGGKSRDQCAESGASRVSGEAKESLALLDSLLSEATGDEGIPSTKIALHIRNEDGMPSKYHLRRRRKPSVTLPMLRWRCVVIWCNGLANRWTALL